MDIGPAVHQSAGLSRYTERLATTIHRHHARDIDLRCFYNVHSNHQPPKHLQELPSSTVQMGQLPWRMSALLSTMLRRNFPPVSSQKLIDDAYLYHATEHLLPHVNRPTVLTVHDLIFEKYPAHHTRRNYLFLRWSMPRFVAAATAVIAVSEHTKSDLVDLYNAPPAKIHVIHEGIDSSFAPAPSAEVTRVFRDYAQNKPYLLMVGTLEPRKNHATAMRMIARRKAAGHDDQLLIVGGKGWLFEPIRAMVDELGVADRVHFLGYVPAADLVPLYAAAECVLVPSLYEGFGFSVLEAMACGTPVICSNVSSLPEIAGNAALLLDDPLDDELLSALVARVRDEVGFADHLRELGLKRAAQFSWQQCAARTVELYKSLSNG